LDGGAVTIADMPVENDEDAAGYEVIAGVGVIGIMGTLVQR
jgi:hypothetical protein